MWELLVKRWLKSLSVSLSRQLLSDWAGTMNHYTHTCTPSYQTAEHGASKHNVQAYLTTDK